MHSFWISPSSSPSAQYCPLSSSPSTDDPLVDHLDINLKAFLRVLRRLLNYTPVYAHCRPTSWTSLLLVHCLGNSDDVSCLIILSSTSWSLVTLTLGTLLFTLRAILTWIHTILQLYPFSGQSLLRITWCFFVTSSEWLVSSILRFLTTLKRLPINCSLPAWTFRHIHVVYLGLVCCRTLPGLLDQLTEHPAKPLAALWSTSRGCRRVTQRTPPNEFDRHNPSGSGITQLWDVSYSTSVSCSRWPSASAPMRHSLSRLHQAPKSQSLELSLSNCSASFNVTSVSVTLSVATWCACFSRILALRIVSVWAFSPSTKTVSISCNVWAISSFVCSTTSAGLTPTHGNPYTTSGAS